MKLLIVGLHGHMGAALARLAAPRHTLCGVDANPDCPRDLSDVPSAPSFAEATHDVDCVVDFSHHSLTHDLLAFALAHKLPLVLATTGQSDDERAEIVSAAREIPLFFAPNYSLGVALLIELAKKTAATFPDAEIEIIERHHDRKLDAPSGTALALADAIRDVRPGAKIVPGRTGAGKREKDEIVIHSLRMGNLAGEHEVIVGTDTQTFTLRHEVHDRAIFAEGALAAVDFLVGKPARLYTMNDLLAK